MDYFGLFEEGSCIVVVKYFFRVLEVYFYVVCLWEVGIFYYIFNINIMIVLLLGGGGDIGLYVCV